MTDELTPIESRALKYLLLRRMIIEKVRKLAETDYRGPRPPEHAIADELLEILQTVEET